MRGTMKLCLLSAAFIPLPLLVLAAQEGKGFFQEVSWSPDGERLSFTTIQTEEPWGSDIFTMKANGKDVHPVPHGLASARWTSWHPDGHSMAFTGKAEGSNDWDVYVIDLETETVTQLTDTDTDESAPAWSPDGSALLFTARVDGRSQVFRMSASGGDRTNLSNSTRDDWNPAWSPDGQRVAFYAAQDTSSDHLWVMRNDGSRQRQVTSGHLRDMFPSWAPDGATIVFSRQQTGTTGVYRMTPAGSVPVEVVDPALYGRLSPNGTRVAYIKGEWPKSEIWVGEMGDERFKHKRVRH